MSVGVTIRWVTVRGASICQVTAASSRLLLPGHYRSLSVVTGESVVVIDHYFDCWHQ